VHPRARHGEATRSHPQPYEERAERRPFDADAVAQRVDVAEIVRNDFDEWPLDTPVVEANTAERCSTRRAHVAVRVVAQSNTRQVDMICKGAGKVCIVDKTFLLVEPGGHALPPIEAERLSATVS
jgi:hypothetical protein